MVFYIDIRYIYEAYSVYAIFGNKLELTLPIDPIGPEDIIIVSRPGGVSKLRKDIKNSGATIELPEERTVDIEVNIANNQTTRVARILANSRTLELIDDIDIPEDISLSVTQANLNNISKVSINNLLRVTGIDNYKVGLDGGDWVSGNYDIFLINAVEENKKTNMLGIALVRKHKDVIITDIAMVHPLALRALLNEMEEPINYIGTNPFIVNKLKDKNTNE